MGRATVPGTILKCLKSLRAPSSSDTSSLSSSPELSSSSCAACTSPGNKDLSRGATLETLGVVMAEEAETTMMTHLHRTTLTRGTMVPVRNRARAPRLHHEQAPLSHSSKDGDLGSGPVPRPEQPQATLLGDTTTTIREPNRMLLSALLVVVVCLEVLQAVPIRSREALHQVRPPHQATQVIDTSRQGLGARVDDEFLGLQPTAGQSCPQHYCSKLAAFRWRQAT
jgi:hypothetical protein